VDENIDRNKHHPGGRERAWISWAREEKRIDERRHCAKGTKKEKVAHDFARRKESASQVDPQNKDARFREKKTRAQGNSIENTDARGSTLVQGRVRRGDLRQEEGKERVPYSRKRSTSNGKKGIPRPRPTY